MSKETIEVRFLNGQIVGQIELVEINQRTSMVILRKIIPDDDDGTIEERSFKVGERRCDVANGEPTKDVPWFATSRSMVIPNPAKNTISFTTRYSWHTIVLDNMADYEWIFELKTFSEGDDLIGSLFELPSQVATLSIDPNMIVNGTISASKLSANTLPDKTQLMMNWGYAFRKSSPFVTTDANS